MTITKRLIEHVTITATPDEMHAVFAYLERYGYHSASVLATGGVMQIAAERDVEREGEANAAV
jgi:hypothetical protein